MGPMQRTSVMCCGRSRVILFPATPMGVMRRTSKFRWCLVRSRMRTLFWQATERPASASRKSLILSRGLSRPSVWSYWRQYTGLQKTRRFSPWTTLSPKPMPGMFVSGASHDARWQRLRGVGRAAAARPATAARSVRCVRRARASDASPRHRCAGRRQHPAAACSAPSRGRAAPNRPTAEAAPALLPGQVAARPRAR